MSLYIDRGYTLEQAKSAGVSELESWYGGKVLDVFDSPALGAPHRYYCAESDQLRMINGKISNTSASLVCGVIPAEPDTDPVYEWCIHTSTKSGKVHTDYVQFTKEVSLTYVSAKSTIANATTVQQIDDLLVSLGAIV